MSKVLDFYIYEATSINMINIRLSLLNFKYLNLKPHNFIKYFNNTKLKHIDLICYFNLPTKHLIKLFVI